MMSDFIDQLKIWTLLVFAVYSLKYIPVIGVPLILLYIYDLYEDQKRHDEEMAELKEDDPELYEYLMEEDD